MPEIFDTLKDATETFGGWIAFPLIFILLGTGIFVTFSLGWIQLRKLKHSFDVVSGKYDNPEDEGDVTHFQALSTALSATIGIGNIAGVAIALRIGGPGALFWMWVTALFGMALKYAECTLSHHYRIIHPDGSASGGPMYYITKGLGEHWKPLAIFFATCAALCSFCTGNMNQANTVASSLAIYKIPTWITGLGISVLVGLVILGGIKRIAAVASKLVPTMAALYCGSALLIIILNADSIIPSFTNIFQDAFNFKTTASGIIPVVIMMGIRRGLFSNEAGQGSAPIAHAAAKTKESVREGAVALMGPFIDTLIVCTLTGLVILTTDALNTGIIDPATGKPETGAVLTRTAFETGLGSISIFEISGATIGSFVVTASVFFFAYSTMVAWSYYGDRSVEYLFGPQAIFPYRCVYVLFNFIGAVLPLAFVWNIGDIALSFMSIPNLIAIAFLTGTLRKLTKDYFSRKHLTYKQQKMQSR